MVLADFTFDGTVASLSSDTVQIGTTVSTFGPGPNTQGASFDFVSRFGPNATYAYWIPQGPLDASPGAPGGVGDGVYTAADNLADGEYMTFTISADPGLALDLTSIDFRTARNGGGGAINRLNLYANVDNGGFVQAGSTVFLGDTSNPPVTTIDLSSITGAETVQFAFVFFNGRNQRGYLDDIVLNGTVIPEPAAGGLILGGLGLLAMLRRRIA